MFNPGCEAQNSTIQDLHAKTHTASTVSDVWKGNTSDWVRCKHAMKALCEDGRKLELWQAWMDCDEGTLPWNSIRSGLLEHVRFYKFL